MKATLKTIYIIESDGNVFQAEKTEEISIIQFLAHGKRANFSFRYVANGKADSKANMLDVTPSKKLPIDK